MPCNVCDPTLESMLLSGRSAQIPDVLRFDDCPDCGAAARIRAMRWAIDRQISPLLGLPAPTRRALMISPAKFERDMLAPWCREIVTASLYGSYSSDHVRSDVTDLKEFADQSFDLVHACCVLDFVPEIEKALRSVHRVLTIGGWYSMQNGRIRYNDQERDTPPFVKRLRENYTAKYYPEGYRQPVVLFGRDWFMRTMRDIGFEVDECRYDDPFTGKKMWWYFSQRMR